MKCRSHRALSFSLSIAMALFVVLPMVFSVQSATSDNFVEISIFCGDEVPIIQSEAIISEGELYLEAGVFEKTTYFTLSREEGALNYKRGIKMVTVFPEAQTVRILNKNFDSKEIINKNGGVYLNAEQMYAALNAFAFVDQDGLLKVINDKVSIWDFIADIDDLEYLFSVEEEIGDDMMAFYGMYLPNYMLDTLLKTRVFRFVQLPGFNYGNYQQYVDYFTKITSNDIYSAERVDTVINTTGSLMSSLDCIEAIKDDNIRKEFLIKFGGAKAALESLPIDEATIVMKYYSFFYNRNDDRAAMLDVVYGDLNENDPLKKTDNDMIEAACDVSNLHKKNAEGIAAAFLNELSNIAIDKGIEGTPLAPYKAVLSATDLAFSALYPINQNAESISQLPLGMNVHYSAYNSYAQRYQDVVASRQPDAPTYDNLQKLRRSGMLFLLSGKELHKTTESFSLPELGGETPVYTEIDKKYDELLKEFEAAALSMENDSVDRLAVLDISVDRLGAAQIDNTPVVLDEDYSFSNVSLSLKEFLPDDIARYKNVDFKCQIPQVSDMDNDTLQEKINAEIEKKLFEMSDANQWISDLYSSGDEFNYEDEAFLFMVPTRVWINGDILGIKMYYFRGGMTGEDSGFTYFIDLRDGSFYNALDLIEESDALRNALNARLKEEANYRETEGTHLPEIYYDDAEANKNSDYFWFDDANLYWGYNSGNLARYLFELDMPLESVPGGVVKNAFNSGLSSFGDGTFEDYRELLRDDFEYPVSTEPAEATENGNNNASVANAYDQAIGVWYAEGTGRNFTGITVEILPNQEIIITEDGKSYHDSFTVTDMSNGQQNDFEFVLKGDYPDDMPADCLWFSLPGAQGPDGALDSERLASGLYGDMCEFIRAG